METVEKRLPRATVQKGKIAFGNLASLHSEKYKLLQREKTVEKLLTSHIIEPERKDGATMKKSFYEEEVENCASALYDGGWRSDERDEIQEEYNLDDEWTDAICEKLKEYERIDKND